MEQLLLELAPAPAPTLDNFHANGNSAIIAAIQTALDDGSGVLYLWGPAGCGKTHLLRAAAGAAVSRGRRAQYLHASSLPVIPELDLLALDDVANLDDEAQIALFDHFNRMRSAGGAIVAAGSSPPADLRLREDLRTRIASGVVMQIRPLSEDEKRSVLSAHVLQRGLGLGPEIIDFLIERYARDLGSLVAAIDVLDRYSLRTQRAITLPLLREAIRLAPAGREAAASAAGQGRMP